MLHAIGMGFPAITSQGNGTWLPIWIASGKSKAGGGASNLPSYKKGLISL